MTFRKLCFSCWVSIQSGELTRPSNQYLSIFSSSGSGKKISFLKIPHTSQYFPPPVFSKTLALISVPLFLLSLLLLLLLLLLPPLGLCRRLFCCLVVTQHRFCFKNSFLKISALFYPILFHGNNNKTFYISAKLSNSGNRLSLPFECKRFLPNLFLKLEKKDGTCCRRHRR